MVLYPAHPGQATDDMAITAEGRKKFVDSAMAIVEKYELDGVDVDWEYPGYTNAKDTTVRAEDKQTYTLLMKELRQRFNKEEKRLGRPLVTSSATGATQKWLDHTDMSESQSRDGDSVGLSTFREN